MQALTQLPTRGLTQPPTHFSEVEKQLWYLDNSHGDDRRFRHDVFKQFPDGFAESIAKTYEHTWHSKSQRDANLFLLRNSERLTRSSINLASDDEDLCHQAKLRADACRRIAAKHVGNDFRAYKHLQFYIEPLGLAMPEVKHAKALMGAIKRLCEPRWWRRSLRKVQAREVEAAAIELGQVHQLCSPYVSKAAYKRRQQQLKKTEELLQTLQATNELGESFTLHELMESSISNPTNRRHELMARLAGFELYAEQQEHVGVFLTFTCPSKFHARFSKSGQPNPRYANLSPKDGQDHLCTMWSRCRAEYGRQGLKPYGFRIAEPHHDATPHWHMLLFIPKHDLNKLISICRHYALQVDGDEPGAEAKRFEAIMMDKSQGSATGYIAKYICKNIDAEHIDEDLYGNPAKDSAQRVNAWASVWGIRQFQQIGGPAVTVWRELRRLREIPEWMQGNALFCQAHAAADDGLWCEFICIMGGHEIHKKDFLIQTFRVWSDKPGLYDEPVGLQIMGVQCGDDIITTRLHTWTIETISISPDAKVFCEDQVSCANLEFC